jgi:hypothetical protein
MPEPVQEVAHSNKIPANRPESRRPDSNRGPLHYEFRVAVTASHQESPQVTPHAGSPGLAMTHDDPRSQARRPLVNAKRVASGDDKRQLTHDVSPPAAGPTRLWHVAPSGPGGDRVILANRPGANQSPWSELRRRRNSGEKLFPLATSTPFRTRARPSSGCQRDRVNSMVFLIRPEARLPGRARWSWPPHRSRWR